MFQIDTNEKTIGKEDQGEILGQREFDSPRNTETERTKPLSIENEERGRPAITVLAIESKFSYDSSRKLVVSPIDSKAITPGTSCSPNQKRGTVTSSRMRSPNNLIYTTLVNTTNSQAIMLLVKFVLFKIMVPLFSFTIAAILIAFVQAAINDYCFYQDLCECQNFFIYLYTIVKEVLHTHGSMILMLYYGTAFVTNGFCGNLKLKILYASFMIFVLAGFFGGYYLSKDLIAYDDLITSNGYVLFFSNLIFTLVTGFFSKGLCAEFLKRILLVSILQLYLFFHRFYFKNYAMFYILMELEDTYSVDTAMNIFKLFLMLYYMLYEFLSKSFLLYFFKKIIKDNNLSYNIVIFALKFISVDVLSIQALNVLTIPLTELLSWVCFLYYIYSIFSTYSNTDVLVNVPLGFLRRILKRKEKKESEEEKSFMNLRSGCIFEANLIVFLRIISYRIFNLFLLFINQKNLYADCTLKEKLVEGHKLLYDTNLIMLMVTHTVLLGLLGVVVYGCKLRKYLFNYHIEDINIFGRLLLFLTCFSYADYALQIYKAFDLVSPKIS